MKKTSSVLFIALSLCLLLTPLLGLAVFGESRPAANEIQAPRPRLRTAEGAFNGEVLRETADAFADRFALRQELVTAWARLNAALGSSIEEQVILGREGWLYYAPTLDDYSGLAADEATLAAITERLAALQKEAEARGAVFLLAVAPNKNSLHGEYMPAWAAEDHDGGTWARLRPLLDEAGVPYADLFDPALPYYRTDSHWTAQGAAMAADRLLAALGRESAYGGRPFTEGAPRVGDLYEMLYPAATGAEPEIVDGGGFAYTALDEPRGGTALNIRTENPAAAGSLLCWRDSFGNALYPYLAESFGYACFSRSGDYDLAAAWDRDYDLVLLEIAERNLPKLAAD